MSYIKAIPSVLSKTANYTVSTNDGDNVQVNVDATSGAATITFYAASGNTGKIITVKKTDSSANAVTIDGNASETLDGSLTATLAKQYDVATYVCDGTNWQRSGEAGSVNGNLVVSGTVTGGTYNGQTISSAASFTGTLATVGNVDINGANLGGALDVTQATNNAWTAIIKSTAPTVGQSYGLQIWAGTNASDAALQVIDKTSAASLLSLTGAGLLTVSGFGAHAFSSAGSTFNHLDIINTTSGTGAGTYLNLTSGTNTVYLQAQSQGYTTSGHVVQSGAVLEADGSGGLSIISAHASGAIRFYSGGTTLRATIDTGGNLIFNPTGANGTVNIGGTTDTGTTVVRNSGGYLWQQSSSLRFKENISSWSIGDAPGQVSLDALRKFVALSPSLWDYKGKHNGAAGFISENLDALPIRNVYGTSPLINYNSDGLPESNRDFALIGLQHLVLQQHDATISQLAARIAALEAQESK